MRPYERERIAYELLTVGEFGLKNKRELWRAHYALSKIRHTARTLLTLPPSDEKRRFEGQALVNRLVKLGVLGENEKKLDQVLSITVNQLLERSLQCQYAKKYHNGNVHLSRVDIAHRHVAVNKQVVDQPAFLVWRDSEQYIRNAPNSTKSTSKPGRHKKRKAKKQ